MKNKTDKAIEAVQYYINVMDEVTDRKWRKKPDHVTAKFLDAEEALRKEQEQGDDIRDILIDFIADWYKDNPTVSKEKIIKMADNYLAKFPNGQPKQVTLPTPLMRKVREQQKPNK